MGFIAKKVTARRNDEAVFNNLSSIRDINRFSKPAF
jgi:hypothetical protein